MASTHFAVSYLSLGFWWCVQPHTPVVWCTQWWAVLVDGNVTADAVGALKKTPATATATAEAARRARKGTPPFESNKCRGLYTGFNRSVARMGLLHMRWRRV